MYPDDYRFSDSKRRSSNAKSLTKVPDRSNRGSYLSLRESTHSLGSLTDGITFQTESEEVADGSPYKEGLVGSSDLLVNGSIGIDKIRLSVPILQVSTDLMTMMVKLLGKYNEPEGKVVIPDFPGVYVRWDKYRQKLIFTFNPSEFTWSQGLQLCPFSMLKPIVKLCISEVLNYGDPMAIPKFLMDEDTGEEFETWPKNWGRHCEVFNIHVAQDFLITDPRFNLSQLEGNQPKKTRAAVSIRNRSVLNTLTHIAGKKATRYSLYNKSHERHSNPRPDAPALAPYTFRFEAQVPRRIIKKSHLLTMDGCTEEWLLDMHEKLWEDSKLGKDLVWDGQLLQELTLRFQSARANELYGYATSRQKGIQSNYSERDVQKLERDLEAGKVDLRVPLTEQGAPYGRLDPQTSSLSAPLGGRGRRRRGNPLEV